MTVYTWHWHCHLMGDRASLERVDRHKCSCLFLLLVSKEDKRFLNIGNRSPYTSYDIPDYSTPLRIKEKVKPPQKSLDELRF